MALWLTISTLFAANAFAATPAPSDGRLTFSVKPAALGEQLVRVSLPLPAGALFEGQGLRISDGRIERPAGVRVLTWHGNTEREKRSARRALVTFPYTFSEQPVSFVTSATPAVAQEGKFPAEFKVDATSVTIRSPKGRTLTARLVAPERTSKDEPTIETVESNAYYLWRRIRVPDAQWPRIIEVRADALGGLVLVAHLQRNLVGDGYAPDLGWKIESDATPSRFAATPRDAAPAEPPYHHRFSTGSSVAFSFDEDRYRIDHPAAPFRRRGGIDVERTPAGGFVYQYLRCTAAEKVPMQESAWQRAEVVIAPAALAPLTATLESPHEEQVDWHLWDELYQTGPPLDLTQQPDLAALLQYHRDAIVRSAARGDDWGNVTAYNDSQDAGYAFGMNRLNHCPAIFEDAWRSGDRRLRDVAIQWCDNFHDLSIWWGPKHTGGTRYNNIRAMNATPPDNDEHFMWRSNQSVDFCTKGYASFWLAYEQTGDPRMKEALDAQINYAAEHLYADRGEARNIGDADDFMRLFKDTGERRYLDQALRLFRELRSKLSAGDLFSQGGQPIEPNPPFINDDEAGYRHPFAKPYIIGYALLGLPQLANHEPGEPKLRDVVHAVADFMAESQDPAGGWRYPHPRSSNLLLSQAIEHAWQLVQADTLLGPQEKHLDAIERVLRQRYHGWKLTGQIPSGVTAWEFVTGKARGSSNLNALYKHPEDRDASRDYTEGRMSFGSSPPEGLVYFPGVLAFYLKHRSASRLLAPPRDDDPLGQLLARANAVRKRRDRAQ